MNDLDLCLEVVSVAKINAMLTQVVVWYGSH